MKRNLNTAIAVAFFESVTIFVSIAWPLAVDHSKRLGERSGDELGWVLAGAGPYVLLGTAVGSAVGMIVLSRKKRDED